jgi:hypothetical protein
MATGVLVAAPDRLDGGEVGHMTTRSIAHVDREAVALLGDRVGERELTVPYQLLPVAVQRQREQAE